jgi:hypothetical protein
VADGGTTTYGSLRFAFPTGSFGTSVTVRRAELSFWHYGADGDLPIKNVEFVKTTTNDPSTATANQVYTEINAATTIYKTQELRGVWSRVKETVVLGDDSSDEACSQLTTLIAGGNPFFFGVRRATDAAQGEVEIGGLNLKYDQGQDWEEDATGAPKASPVLTITWDESSTPSSLAEFDMVYTTEDPSSAQSTPSNSIGSYAASNTVYTKTQVGEQVGAAQTTIALDSSGSLPSSSSGLVQIGPEVMRYGSVDTTNYLLLNVERAVSPAASFPASMYPTNDFVHFLEIDDLFNNRPTTGLEQYRCVAIKLVSDVIIESPQVLLRQDPDSDVQIDIGIEVPQFDRHSGLTVGFTEGKYFQSDSADVLGYATDYFVGAHVVMDPAGSPVDTIVTSYDQDGSVATFLVEDTISQADNTSFRINPAPAWRAPNDATRPVENSGRFLGFLDEGGSDLVVLEEQGTDMRQYDLFYIWIKRILTERASQSTDTGAVIMVKIDASSIL